METNIYEDENCMYFQECYLVQVDVPSTLLTLTKEW